MNYILDIIEFSIKAWLNCEDKFERAGIKYGTKMMMRQYSRSGAHWSEKAEEFRVANNIPKELLWDRQPKYDPGRKNLTYEHMVPLEEIWQKLLRDPDNTHKIMKEQSIVVWITKDEDRELTRLGYRSKRPDPAKAYSEANIKIIFNT